MMSRIAAKINFLFVLLSIVQVKWSEKLKNEKSLLFTLCENHFKLCITCIIQPHQNTFSGREVGYQWCLFEASFWMRQSHCIWSCTCCPCLVLSFGFSWPASCFFMISLFSRPSINIWEHKYIIWRNSPITQRQNIWLATLATATM